MFRPMNRKKQQLTEDECLQVLREAKRGVLAVTGDDGYPYAAPLNHFYCEEDGRLYFHSGPTGHRSDAMRRDNRVCFSVIDGGTPAADGWSLDFKSVIVFGHTEPVTDHARALAITKELCYKFTEDEAYIENEIRTSGANVFVFSVIIEHMSGKLVHEH